MNPLKAFPIAVVAFGISVLLTLPALAQIGTRFPSEKKVVIDPVTGVSLTFLTSRPAGDSKIYQTHRQWTADNKWVIFRSDRVPAQAMAVHEKTGVIVQITETGYSGMLCLAEHSMNLYFMRTEPRPSEDAGTGVNRTRDRRRRRAPRHIIQVDLAKLSADSEAGKMQPAAAYERVCGTIPAEVGASGDMALDPTEEYAYFRAGRDEAARHQSADVKNKGAFGPRGMGAGPSGLSRMNLKTGEVTFIVAVPFQIGHVQSNPWVSGEIVFCWETAGKAPQRTWIVKADGTGLRPLYPEAPYEWVTHEAVITKDEVAFAIMGNRAPGTQDAWGISGTREHPTGLGIVNLRTREMRIAGQTHDGSGLWHVHGSPDGRWAVGDDFSRSIYLIDRRTGEMILLSTGHKSTAADHPHPSFSPDSSKILIQSAMLSEDNRSMNLCFMPVPDSWLRRTYREKTR